MAQHAAALGHNNQLHPAMANIPMLSAAGLNLTVSFTSVCVLVRTRVPGKGDYCGIGSCVQHMRCPGDRRDVGS